VIGPQIIGRRVLGADIRRVGTVPRVE